MEISIESGEVALAAHLAQPATRTGAARPRGLVLCHGFPTGPRGAPGSARTYPDLAERLAADTGWVVLTFNFRGTGASGGDFSLEGWLDDIRAAVDHLVASRTVRGVWLAGSGVGGALAVCAASEDSRVRGVASLGAPADFEPWVADPPSLLATARAIGVVRDPAFPPDPDGWARQLSEIRPLTAAGKLPPRPVLLLHGANDRVVPVQDARALADAADGRVELRILGEAGPRLRHDPRAVALLIGWMERQAPG